MVTVSALLSSIDNRHEDGLLEICVRPNLRLTYPAKFVKYYKIKYESWIERKKIFSSFFFDHFSATDKFLENHFLESVLFLENQFLEWPFPRKTFPRMHFPRKLFPRMHFPRKPFPRMHFPRNYFQKPDRNRLVFVELQR